MRANAHMERQKPRVPQVGPSGRNLPETQDPKVKEENDP